MNLATTTSFGAHTALHAETQHSKLAAVRNLIRGGAESRLDYPSTGSFARSSFKFASAGPASCRDRFEIQSACPARAYSSPL